MNSVRKLRGELSELKVEKEDVHEEVLVIEKKAKNYMMDAANLADELRSEQGNSPKAEEAFEFTDPFGNCNLVEYEFCRESIPPQGAAS